MNHIMLDIDGTLIQSNEFDEKCFVDAVHQATGIKIKSDWVNYPNVTDRGILKTFIKRQAPQYSLNELEDLVKPIFIENIKNTLLKEPAKEVSGAKEFVLFLIKNDNYVLSVATGGWAETAKLKLESAGFEVDNLVIASSNDHYSRIEIMELAKQKVDSTLKLPITYFGDALWDVKACEELGVNLVIVGDGVSHHQSVTDFSEPNNALSFV